MLVSTLIVLGTSAASWGRHDAKTSSATNSRTSGPPESTAVMYPAPWNWSHAWPYDITTSVALDPNVTVELDTGSSSMHATRSANLISDDPIVANILSRYQTFLRNKASASPSIRQIPATMPILSIVLVSITGGAEALKLGSKTDEGYNISIVINANLVDTPVTGHILSTSVFGARHGLESFAQLVQTPAGTIAGLTTATPIFVEDRPMWPYRGLMIDTGRHYLGLDTIRRAIDGMAALKLNVLHWHILDSESFPIKSEKFPQLSGKGAYSSMAVYSLDDLREIVAYARERSVRVVPEIEMPGHGSFSAGMPELSLSSCSDVLDVTKNSTYTFLTEFLLEIASVFEDELIYLGGDEVGFDPKCSWPGISVCGYHCFDKDPAVSKWMTAMGLNSSQMIDYFWTQITEQVIPAFGGNRTVGVWMANTPNGASGVWPPPNMATLPKGSVANVYQSMQTASPLLDQGVPVVLSVAGSDWYLDYHPDFASVYKVRPCDQLDCKTNPNRRSHLLGGSVSQWGESVDGFNFDADVWIGASALAERLWRDFDPQISGPADAELRHHNLQCHWSMWGFGTYTRQAAGSEYTAIKDTNLDDLLCPGDWTEPPK